MRYPVVANWVTYSKDKNGYYHVYDEASEDKYRMSPREFEFLCALDGYTNPYTVQTSWSREKVQIFLEALKQDLLIRDSRILYKSLGQVLVTIWSVERTSVQKRISTAADRLLSLLWLPLFLSGLIYMLNHDSDIVGAGHWVLGSIFGFLTGMIIHELGHAAACLHYGGKVFEFGLGINMFIMPCAYVLLNMKNIKSRRKRAHVNAAGVESNLLLAGAYMYLACFVPGAGRFLVFAAIQNIIFASLNLIFVKGIDGMGVISEYIGCSNLFAYAKTIIFDRRRRQQLYRDGINGWVTLSVCFIGLALQIGMPLLIALNLVFIMI